MEARSATTINAAPEGVYAAWRDFERLPAFMYHLQSVSCRDDRHSHWVVKGPAGTTVEWDAEITEDVPGERIAWRSIAGAAVDNSGVVRFRPAPRRQGTEVYVELEYSPPGRALGAFVLKLFGEEPNQQISDDLRRFKQLVETGEVARSDALPDGGLTQTLFDDEEASPLDEVTA